MINFIGCIFFIAVFEDKSAWRYTYLVIINVLWAIPFLAYLIFMFIHGCGGLDKFKTTGSYKVGAKQFWS
jgi:hypothetical protein